MANKPCCICGEMVGFFDRTVLDDGIVCDKCWEVVLKENPGMEDAYLFSMEQVREAYRVATSPKTEQEDSKSDSTDSNPVNNVVSAPEPNHVAVQAEPQATVSLWEKIKITGSILGVIFGIILIWIASTGNVETILADIWAKISPSDNSYVTMVKNLRPIEGGRTYEQAFEGAFNYNSWSYYKTDGTRYVEVESYDDNENDSLITTFELQPEGESTSGSRFMIRVCSMRTPQGELNEFEIGSVAAMLFGEELQYEFMRYMLQ